MRNIHYGVALVLACCIVFFINPLPSGTIIASGDFWTFVDPKMLHLFFYTWFDVGTGMASALHATRGYYGLKYLLFQCGCDLTTITKIFLLLFFFLSYSGAYRLARMLLPSDDFQVEKIAMAYLYAFAAGSVVFLSHSWGYDHHSIIYWVLPFVASYSLECFQSNRTKKNYMFYGILSIIFSMAYNNIVFFIVVCLVQAALALILFFQGTKGKKIGGDLCLLYGIQFLTALYILGPYILSNIGFVGGIGDSKTIGNYVDWIRNTSVDAVRVLGFAIHQEGGYFMNRSYTNLSLYLGILNTICLLLLGYWAKRNKKLYGFLVFFLLLLVLVSRFSRPFETINEMMYGIPGMSIFRSSDKLFLIYNIFYCSLVLLLIAHAKKKISKIILFFFVLCNGGGFYLTGSLSNILLGIDRSQSKASEYKTAVTIPQEYYQLQNYFDTQNRDESILHLPYNKINSYNRSNYPKRGFVGFDITQFLYQQSSILANSFDHSMLENKLSLLSFNANSLAENTALLQKFGAGHIVYHKDVDPSFLGTADSSIKVLVQDNRISKIFSGIYVDLYRIESGTVMPLISSTSIGLQFQKISPVSYHFSVRLQNPSDSIIFRKAYSPGWKLFLEPRGGSGGWQDFGRISPFEQQHSMYEDYAHVRVLGKDTIVQQISNHFYHRYEDGSIGIQGTIYFVPQLLYYLGLFIWGCFIFGWIWTRKK